MRAVAMLLHAQLRPHWKSWLALAAAATGRRTAAAFPGFTARHGYDAVVYGSHPLRAAISLPRAAAQPWPSSENLGA